VLEYYGYLSVSTAIMFPLIGPAQRILLFFAYTRDVPSRSCIVSFTDPEGIEHSVRVSAASLYEAAVVALAEFRKHGFADTTFGPATKLNVRVKAPEAAHVVSVGKVKTWLEGGAKSPNEQVEKNRLKYLLTR
jgi:hypothetical protein